MIDVVFPNIWIEFKSPKPPPGAKVVSCQWTLAKPQASGVALPPILTQATNQRSTIKQRLPAKASRHKNERRVSLEDGRQANENY